MDQRTGDNLRSDVATIKANVENLIKSFDDFRREQRSVADNLDNRLSVVENTQAKQGERISNWNLFQVAFATTIGAIATYLGARK